MEWITCLKDIILMGTAITASFVAVMGLNTWKKQLKGKDEYELAKRLLLNLYKYKNSFGVVRHPAVFNYEGESEDLDKITDQKELRYKRTATAYQKRWEKVVEIRNKVDLDLLEAKILFGDEVLELYKPLLEFERKLFLTVQDYLTLVNPHEDNDWKSAVQKIYHKEEKSKILYDLGESDEFRVSIEDNVTKIEEYFAPKLKKF